MYAWKDENMRINNIPLRDPYIIFENDTYYLYGSKSGNGKIRFYQNDLEVYKSKDLIEWSEGKSLFGDTGFYHKNAELWAPEIYRYNDMYYMFVTIKIYGDEKETRRGTYVFSSDAPDGEFSIHSPKAITPEDWECLDGSLYIEDEEPYMVFCHEWKQCAGGDGEICIVKMNKDLTKSDGEVKRLFSASEAEWTYKYSDKAYVTDGPFLFKDDTLYMLWSSFTENGYAVGMAYSPSGSIMGEWKHSNSPLYENDGGHAMLFETKEKERKIILHSPNDLSAVPKIFNFAKCKGRRYVVK